ncbi:MAG: demethylmenaquinone methyltransferase [Actinomycetales bacterium]|nr:demethylmenaquinone methyltransferase [Actinomycetales bacterium]
MSKADLAKKPEEVAAMFDAVAPTYDLTNGLLSFGQDRRWRKVVANAVDPKRGQRILDLAAGTGTSSMAFLRDGVEVIASDFSEGMLAEGRKRHPELEFVFADATNLPFKDAEFDAVTISFGLRNVVDVPKALAEMYRVTKPGGRIVICEFSHVKTPVLNAAYSAYLKTVLPAFSGLASKTPEAYGYLAESILAWPDQNALAKLVNAAGFERVEFRNLNLGVVAVHRGYKAKKAAK